MPAHSPLPERGTAAAALEVQDLHVAYHHRLVLERLHARIPAGQITVLIGPNGSGKSTLLKALARLLPSVSGQILLEGQRLDAFSRKALARQLSLLPQGAVVPEGATVAELVAHGRFPHRRLLRKPSPADQAAIAQAIAVTGLQDWRDTPVEELSGGQRQRVWVAMTVAQDSPVMLLDEPTTYLDINYQMELLALLQQLNRQWQRTLVLVLHDINLAARVADHMIALKDGAIVAQGAPEHVVTAPMLRQIFGIEAQLFTDPGTGKPWFIPCASTPQPGTTASPQA
ncbi:ABC transporter ATP-binding protein [Corticibacter populi]|uniref:ABC transporter ATP-binding protein n=1 Tax=Corticibacter populi TaxID=1550736 RepID=A0A3M6R0D7_9BURK|nr:ABC transporter ATP-binding protein [Corticibacter populi]RMX08710.1 ABC transporter ATP-binding protein [Corticibacter populi]RZS36059.1 iron complex transport system ATP-binding protein [Corticibacter populi]